MAFMIKDFTDKIGPSLPYPPDKAGVHAAIAALDINDIFKSRGTIVRDVRGWRVDIQNSSGNHINISVQKNGVAGMSTVASVMVPHILRPDTSRNSDVTEARTKELSKAVRRGLVESLRTHSSEKGKGQITRKEVIGGFSTKKSSQNPAESSSGTVKNTPDNKRVS
ncbi:hypothetical protein [Tatumella morbirosei]|nr:hypothetical protein [Tatumella morbirosei]